MQKAALGTLYKAIKLGNLAMQLIFLSEDLHHCLGCQLADEKFIHLQAWEQSSTYQNI